MRVSAACVVLPLAVQAANLVLSNDDGWAELNIRTFYNALKTAGENVIVSAPAQDKSGSGSLDVAPTPLTGACEFNSCPAGSPAYGFNASDTHLNYVNSYPVTSIKYGISNLSTEIFGGPPDLAVTGFNVGSNLGASVLFSGTVGAASEAAKEGIPAIAFSGSTGSQIAWTAATPNYASVYADLATNVTQALLASGTPYLPASTFLNVNFGAVTDTSCASASDFKFVLSRIFTATFVSGKDVVTCGNNGRLPTESTVVATAGCWASISVGKASTKTDSDAATQAVVLQKLGGLLSCLP